MARFRLRLKDREITLPDVGEVVVGRDPSCDVPIDDRLASRRHASFRVAADGNLEVVDLESLNGLRVNEDPVKGTRLLGHRDRVQIGAHVFVVHDQQRERRGEARTTRSMPMRAAATRPVNRASRGEPSSEPSGESTPLDVIASALESGDVAAAASAMDAVVSRYVEGSEPLAAGELARVTLLLLSMTERTREARFFDRIFQIHSARRMVIDASAIDAVQAALPRLSGIEAGAVETYLEVMGVSAAALSTQDQVRLRRVATVAHRVRRGEPS